MKERHLNIYSKKTRSDYNLYIFLNHDESLLCWFLEKERLNIENFFLITIDKHIDLTNLPEELIDKLNKFQSSEEQLTFYKLREIIEKKFRHDNVFFIYAAMELGLINDVLIISPSERRNDHKEEYKDHSGKIHKIYYICYVTDLWHPSGLGILNDNCDPKKKEIKEKIDKSDVIMDIDLDYFTYKREDKIFVINLENFDRILNNSHLEYLLKYRTKVLTIALEPTSCDGIRNSIQIFSRLLEYFKSFSLID
ncbi:MAG: hypothetical protein ACFFAN_05235 [Promethearchaeota archaeon]